MTPDLKIYWCTNQEEARELAEFFVRHVKPNPEYISHSEIQLGRALDENHWFPNLDDVVLAEFLAKTPKDGHPLAEGGVVAARSSSQLLAVAVVGFNEDGGAPYAVLEDLLVEPSVRGHRFAFPQSGSARPVAQLGVGGVVFAWIEKEARGCGMARLFLESGLHNERAHAFFKRCGFHNCSVVMMKELNS